MEVSNTLLNSSIRQWAAFPNGKTRILHSFGKMDNKKERFLCFFTTAMAIDDRQKVNEQIVDEKE